MDLTPATDGRARGALVAAAASLLPAFLLVLGVGLTNDGFFGGFAIGVSLVLAVTIGLLARTGLRAGGGSAAVDRRRDG